MSQSHMTATPEQIATLRHMLGLTDDTQRKLVSYRNHYATEKGDEHIAAMVEAGLVESVDFGAELAGGLEIYITTAKGRSIADANVRKTRRSKGARLYARFLDISDVRPRLTFREFLTSPEYAQTRREA